MLYCTLKQSNRTVDPSSCAPACPRASELAPGPQTPCTGAVAPGPTRPTPVGSERVRVDLPPGASSSGLGAMEYVQNFHWQTHASAPTAAEIRCVLQSPHLGAYATQPRVEPRPRASVDPAEAQQLPVPVVPVPVPVHSTELQVEARGEASTPEAGEGITTGASQADWAHVCAVGQEVSDRQEDPVSHRLSQVKVAPTTGTATDSHHDGGLCTSGTGQLSDHPHAPGPSTSGPRPSASEPASVVPGTRTQPRNAEVHVLTRGKAMVGIAIGMLPQSASARVRPDVSSSRWFQLATSSSAGPTTTSDRSWQAGNVGSANTRPGGDGLRLLRCNGLGSSVPVDSKPVKVPLVVQQPECPERASSCLHASTVRGGLKRPLAVLPDVPKPGPEGPKGLGPLAVCAAHGSTGGGAFAVTPAKLAAAGPLAAPGLEAELRKRSRNDDRNDGRKPSESAPRRSGSGAWPVKATKESHSMTAGKTPGVAERYSPLSAKVIRADSDWEKPGLCS